MSKRYNVLKKPVRSCSIYFILHLEPRMRIDDRKVLGVLLSFSVRVRDIPSAEPEYFKFIAPSQNDS